MCGFPAALSAQPAGCCRCWWRSSCLGAGEQQQTWPVPVPAGPPPPAHRPRPPCPYRPPSSRRMPRRQPLRSPPRSGAASSWCVQQDWLAFRRDGCRRRTPSLLPRAHASIAQLIPLHPLVQVHKEALTKGVANPTVLFRFALPDKDHEPGLPVASCLLVRAPIGSEKPDGSRAFVLRYSWGRGHDPGRPVFYEPLAQRPSVPASPSVSLASSPPSSWPPAPASVGRTPQSPGMPKDTWTWQSR